MELFNAPYQIFTAVFLCVFSLCLIEIILFFFGATVSSFFENSDADLDFSADFEGLDTDLDFLDSAAASGIEISPSSFFNIGKIPFYIIVMFLGLSFGFFGIFLHHFFQSMGISLSNIISVPISVIFASLSTWLGSSLLVKILPGDESFSISESSFVGREATVETGIGNKNQGVMISFIDEFNVTHRLIGTVALDGLSVKENDKVVILSKNIDEGGFYILPSFGGLNEINKQVFIEESPEVALEELKYMSMTKD